MAGFGLNLKLVLYSQSQCLNKSLGFLKPPPSPICKTLPASLKDDTTRMKDRNKHKQVTGQMNHQTADPKVNASVFLFFSTAHFLKIILALRTNATFGFARHTSRPFAKPKEPFFCQHSCKVVYQ